MNRAAFILMCLGILSCATRASAAELELVTLQYPPYVYAENGEVRGIAADIVREALRRLGQPVKITLLPWARAIKMIEGGHADAIFTAYKTPERELFADYSREVLMPQAVSFFVRADSSIRFDGGLESVKGYRFGIVRQVSYGHVFDSALKSGFIRETDVSDTGELNMAKLLAGRFDILVSNKLGALYILKQTGEAGKVRELSPEVESLPSYIAFSKRRNLAPLRDRFDEALAGMKKDGTYDKIIRQYVG